MFDYRKINIVPSYLGISQVVDGDGKEHVQQGIVSE